jgi:hypothetical protein
MVLGHLQMFSIAWIHPTCQGNSPGIALTPPTILDAGVIPHRQAEQVAQNHDLNIEIFCKYRDL